GSAQEPSYIKGYPPGVRENGGQYTHAAAWVIMAMAKLGSGDEVAELFHMINPINHDRTRCAVAFTCSLRSPTPARDPRSISTRRNRTSWPATCTDVRPMSGAAAGAGTLDR